MKWTNFVSASPALEEGRLDHGQLNFVTPYFWDRYTLIEQPGTQKAVKYSIRAVSYFNLQDQLYQIQSLMVDFLKFYSIQA